MATSNDSNQDKGDREIQVRRYTNGAFKETSDIVAVEEPMEIRVVSGPKEQRRGKGISITMRTPGTDDELAAGFLLSESIVSHPDQILSFEHVGPAPENGSHGNTMRVELGYDVELKISDLQRHFYTTSSCGVCGKASLDAVRAQNVQPVRDNLVVTPQVILNLPNQLREQQKVFDRTGGLHAAGLAESDGSFIAIREDVGRHNAVDKLIGSQMIAGDFPLSDKILVVSGRASFELVQKALTASISMLVAVGAPSSLAIELAEEFGLTLVGFNTQGKFNIYCGFERVAN